MSVYVKEYTFTFFGAEEDINPKRMEVTEDWINSCKVPAALVITQMIEASRTSETSVNFCQNSWHDNQGDSHVHICRQENLKSQTVNRFVKKIPAEISLSKVSEMTFSRILKKKIVSKVIISK
ncbi:uncharacterized protein LOC110826791 [Zootermopsis nevadensis]|uniref:uncharacterized protein LOC110826791 n=1 Tax=Zootermopsis nevadensis TaxID=136037 RepID=UPI000B8E6ADA|nr:uncharacterized protein LOC110826791 [Zootermopsis nevadensis]